MNSPRQEVSAPTRELARWIAQLCYADLPARTRETVRIALLDTLGCGVYGHSTPWAKMILQWARTGAPARGEATVWGETAPTLRAADAALVNGVAAHGFELDDYHNAKLHAGAVVIPAALALAEKLDASGERLVTAIAAGYEVMIRSSLAMHPSATRLRGWHITGVCGPFGASAACAVLLGLNDEQTAWALGLAGTQGSGVWAFNADGTMSKRFHAGRAAYSGVLAAELAAIGFTGPTQIYEFHDGGVLKAYSDRSDPAPLTAELGTVYRLDTNRIKPYSCCGSTHSYVDAAFELRRRLGTPWDAKRRVRVGLAKVVDVQCGFPYIATSALNAQMSMRYVVATALLEGQVLPPQFSDRKLSDPAITELAQKIELEHDPALDQLYPERFAAWIAVEDAGKWERVDVLDPLGSDANPVGERGVIEKFRGINPQLPVDAIADAVLHIERHTAKDLLALLAGKRARQLQTA
ncbi:MAG TPA: MmgE/PrpD family protein [Burkholderiales bacterium]|nr:MmgE/PrpD family protein [Burkholderiales bacterium]